MCCDAHMEVKIHLCEVDFLLTPLYRFWILKKIVRLEGLVL